MQPGGDIPEEPKQRPGEEHERSHGIHSQDLVKGGETVGEFHDNANESYHKAFSVIKWRFMTNHCMVKITRSHLKNGRLGLKPE